MGLHKVDCPLNSISQRDRVPPKPKAAARTEPRGSSAPFPWGTSYAGETQTSDPKPKTTGKLFRSLAGELGFAQICRMSELEAKSVCGVYKLCPPETNRRCWKCAQEDRTSTLEEKQWADRPPTYVCTFRGCKVRLAVGTAYSPMYNTNMS